MKKTNKKQIPKVRLPKYYVGGSHKFNESMYDSSQSTSTQGTKDAYNEKRSKSSGLGNASNYAIAAANTAGNYVNVANDPNLNSAQRTTGYTNAANQTADAVLGAVPVYGQLFGAAKGVSDMALSAGTKSNIDPNTGEKAYQGKFGSTAAVLATPTHTNQITAWGKLLGGDTSAKNLLSSFTDPTVVGAIDAMTTKKDKYGDNQKAIDAKNKEAEAAYNQQQMAAQQQQTDFINNAVQSGMANYNQNNPQGGGGSTLQYGKYGGQMKYAMGGMKPNAEVENNEMITSDTPPQVFNNGGVELASNNPYGTPTYKTNGASHENGGIPMNMAPGSIINGKTKNPLTGNKFTKDVDIIAKMENKYTKKAENGDRYSNTNAKLILPILAQKKDYLNNLQNAIIANNEQRKALNRGELPQPSMDNKSMEQGQSEQSEGEYKYGGIHINPANKGKFTASAQRAGMGTQEFASHVLANKEDYSSTQVKRANFAHNAAGWKHEMGGMQQYALGGVQLPYYNTDRNGNPKYAMGGFSDGDLTPVTTSTVAPTPVKLPTDFKSRNEFDTFYKSQPGYARDPRNKSGVNVGYYPTNKYKYNEGTNTFSNIGDTLSGSTTANFGSIPSSDFMEYTPTSGVKGAIGSPASNANWQTNQLLRGGGNKLTFPSGDTQIVAPKKVFAYGGKMPKYALGGEEDGDNGLGYTPKNPAEAYRMQQAAKMNNARYSQKSSYSPNVLPWEKTNDSENTPNNPYVNSKVNPYNNIDAADRKAEREAREAAEIAGTGSGTPPMNNIDWSKTDKFGNLFNFIGQNAGNIYNLSRYNKPEIETYERAKASYLDNTAAMRDAEQEARRDEYAVRGASGGKAGTYLANRVGLNIAKVMNKDRIRQQYANANAQIGNQNAQFNADIAMREVIANAQNRARDRSGKGEAIGDIGQNFGVASKAGKQGAMDQNTLELMMKYYNTPEFQKMMKDNKYKK